MVSKKSNDELVIDLQNITRTFGSDETSVIALNKVDLQIKQGEFVAIMGRSGSGKSTLMNIIGLLDRKFSGTYKLRGKKVSGFSENQTADIRGNSIGFVFQQFNLLKRTAVLENVLLPTTFAPAADDQLRALKIIKAVGLGDKVATKSNLLSGGQIQRVAIARALIMDPDIILADEPTGNLDSQTAGDIMKLLKEINEQGKTIVLITHEDDIAAYASRTVNMLDGEIVGAKKTSKSKNSKKSKKTNRGTK